MSYGRPRRLAITITELVRRGNAEQLHLLLTTVNLRELALCLGALGALANAMGDQLDSVCIGQGIPVMATDMCRKWLASLDQVPVASMTDALCTCEGAWCGQALSPRRVVHQQTPGALQEPPRVTGRPTAEARSR